jgi:Xaa-Pro aminopeptidase
LSKAEETSLLAECLHGGESDADFLYATGFVAPDPLFWFRKGRRSHLIVPPLELGRARATARVDHVLDASVIERRLARRHGTAPKPLDVPVEALRSKGVTAVAVPERFPLGTAEALRAAGVDVVVRAGSFFPGHAVKAPHELRSIALAQHANECALEAASAVLRAARIRRGELFHDGTRVTSEMLKYVIDVELLRHGCIGRHTIVASGDQCVDPHDTGSGAIRAHTTVILDIFPRHTASGYFADMTRTVVRGRPGARVRAMYAAVEAAQEFAFARVHGGADAQAIHLGIVDLFRDAGFPTGVIDGRMQGFFHGTGHGVGLDIHESPSFGNRPSTLPCGAVVTVEPGLYYAGVGGVRLEDMVLVTDEGCENLTQAPKLLEI